MVDLERSARASEACSHQKSSADEQGGVVTGRALDGEITGVNATVERRMWMIACRHLIS